MQGAGGSRPASPKFLRFLREKTQELGALLIFDEVMTSRLHWNGGLSGKYGIKPDLITMGKYLGGGMSFGLFGGRADIMNLYNPVTGGTVAAVNSRFGPSAPLSLAHSGTFNNNLMTMQAGIAGAKILTEDVLTALNEKGDHLRHALSELLVLKGFIQHKPDEVIEDDIDAIPRGKVWVSGIGSLLSLHFGVNDELAELRDLYWFYLLERGFYIARRGFITLNIALTDGHMAAFLQATGDFLDQWCAEP
ncbi:hypothetical protein NQ176_g10172 [Zarea fungicola]|uniref:Uncharacterized protein n=1 Tax=Zarea fungicola TaxID=93591 RepID=A0ACC1MIA3_9HYPO|nr:hypothetical protein NQ176_g10172 [Lecanicillium fungicola]